MDDIYKLREYGNQTVVSFQTSSLMNTGDVERLRADLIRLVDEEKRTHLILDFRRVQFLSSQVIGILLTLNKKLTGSYAGGANFVLCGVGPQLIELLKISRLDRILTIKPTRKDALGG
jgi:anti-sigma B factor antagonist